jgi:hypothetical protein
MIEDLAETYAVGEDPTHPFSARNRPCQLGQ